MLAFGTGFSLDCQKFVNANSAITFEFQCNLNLYYWVTHFHSIFSSCYVSYFPKYRGLCSAYVLFFQSHIPVDGVAC